MFIYVKIKKNGILWNGISESSSIYLLMSAKQEGKILWQL